MGRSTVVEAEEGMKHSGCTWVTQVRELCCRASWKTHTCILWMRQHLNCCTQTALMSSQRWLDRGNAGRQRPAKNWGVCPFPLPLPCLAAPEELALAEEQAGLLEPDSVRLAGGKGEKMRLKLMCNWSWKLNWTCNWKRLWSYRVSPNC